MDRTHAIVDKQKMRASRGLGTTAHRVRKPFHFIQSTSCRALGQGRSSRLDEGIEPPNGMPRRQRQQVLRWFSSQSTELMLRQLAMLSRSGLDIGQCLRSAREGSKNTSIRNLCRRLEAMVAQGYRFSQAMERAGGLPQIVVQLIRLGEASGELSNVLEQSADYMEKSRTARSEVISALAYPALITAFSLGLAFYLIVAVIPELERFLTTMGRPLPPLTQQLVAMAQWLKSNVPVVITTAVSGAAIWFIASRNPRARRLMHLALLKAPIIGTVFQFAATSSVAHAMGAMIGGGVKLVDAVRIAGEVQTNAHLKSCLEDAVAKLLSGQRPSRALSVNSGFQPILIGMLAAAEKTGELSKSLMEAARFADLELNSRLKRISRLLEPVVIVAAGCVVGFVYMAFFTALMSAGTNVR